MDNEELAKTAGLIYVNDQKPGITRIRKKNQFKYIGLDGKIITDQKTIKRINALAIPPAYTDVWICPKPHGHIQATARDAKGRKQYRYHSEWRKIRDEDKYNKVIAFGHALPSIRKRVNRDLALPGLPKEKILATVVYLLGATLIRVGNEEYAKENRSFGLTTLRHRHVEVEGSKITFKFRGKSGKYHSIALQASRLAKIVKKCKELPGHELFEYMDEEGNPHPVTSTEVNTYLQEITQDNFTAKDFRTWAGTVLAAFTLQEFQHFASETEAKKNIVQAIEKVAKKLGNTPSICRKCYIHPEIFHAYMDKTLLKIIEKRIEHEITHDLEELSHAEAVVHSFLEQRLAQ